MPALRLLRVCTVLLGLFALVLLPVPALAAPDGGFTENCDGVGCNDTAYGDDTETGGDGTGPSRPAPCGVPLNDSSLAPVGTIIPCNRSLDGISTTWDSTKKCYWRPVQNLTMDGQPVTMTEYAELMGRPGQTAVECVQIWDGGRIALGLGGYTEFWVSGGGGPDPEAVARLAIAQMGLRAPQIGMTGGSPPDGMQIVGIPAWMWVADPGESTTGPVTRSASDGGITVTATARLDRTVWRTGDGATVTCAGAKAAGTPYEARYDKQPSPTCGHTYTRTSAEQPDQVYTVTVTAYWAVEWSVVGGGPSGTITQQMSRYTYKQVGELQALIVGPGDRT